MKRTRNRRKALRTFPKKSPQFQGVSTMSKHDQLQAALEHLSQAIPGLKGSLLGTLDGMPIVQAINDQSVDPARVAAMAATAIGVSRRITESLRTGQVREMSLLATEGRIFIYLVGTKACLALIAQQETNVGLIQIETSDTVEQLASIL